MDDLPDGLPPVIDCVECGGRAHLLTAYEQGFDPQPGDIVTYICAACNHRMDVEVGEDENEESD